jgi:hypothetical protein
VELMNKIPDPTADEQYTVDLHIGEWAGRTPVQRGLCLGLLRGHNSLPKLESYLGVSQDVLWDEMQGLGDCIRWSDPQELIQIH